MAEFKITDVDVIERVALEVEEESEVNEIEQSLKRELIDRGHSASEVKVDREGREGPEEQGDGTVSPQTVIECYHFRDCTWACQIRK